jgi:5-methylcytosine-specific restriction endonuclease McrA
MARRKGEKWFAIKSELHDPHIPTWQLSDAAYRLYLGSIAYTVGQEWESVPNGAASYILGRRSRKAVSELEDKGLWTSTQGHRPDVKAWTVMHEGTFWRRGLPPAQRRPIPKAIRAEVFERDDYGCVLCGAEDFLTLDHVFPWSQGGEDTADNLRVLCRRCNSSKGARIRAEEAS